ncbi:DUF6248 family natural product biosynthesis protein [Thermomonospora cellulosilytica]|uniref:Uncharacterized protein n=1 Tax=Thermomonospora cellulosilytica TaxID=1411118 RepID=A0A7W3R8L0_9ACTN|nr:DUF6248 family natural product biosynthesis protein [Thermomonospora cellulosilytica]MBA9003689.1 hypothetical protein [Thermomonospora cellulosilytica]
MTGPRRVVDVPLPDEITLPPAVGPTPEQAAWIREHVWTKAMRKSYRETPEAYHACACQYGMTTWCNIGQHDRCHRATPQPDWETIICGPDGMHPLHFAGYYRHPVRASATGPHPSALPLVWLADRVCRWVCPCACHATPAAPVQLDLFAEVTA